MIKAKHFNSLDLALVGAGVPLGGWYPQDDLVVVVVPGLTVVVWAEDGEGSEDLVNFPSPR